MQSAYHYITRQILPLRSAVTFKQRRRQLAARIFPPIVWALILIIWRTCRIQVVLGQEHLQRLLETEEPFIPCYWHQQQIFCVRFLLDAAARNQQLKLGYLISPSADGDIATNMFGKQGVHIIRGSATRGGAQALREIYTAIRQNKISPIVTPDGPTGPIYECKPGVAMISNLSRAPLLPLAYAANRVWRLRSWDKFMLPVPFSTIVIAVGPAVEVTRSDAEDDYQTACTTINRCLNDLSEDCQKVATELPN